MELTAVYRCVAALDVHQAFARCGPLAVLFGVGQPGVGILFTPVPFDDEIDLIGFV